MHAIRRGTGRPVLLVHGLGATSRSWDPILPGLARHREVVAVDLPGFGESPPLPGEVSIATLADALQAFLEEDGLQAVDTVGSSMGARLVLELARRGLGGTAVALDPGGFWSHGELRLFATSLRASIALVRAIQPVLPALVGNPVGRTALLPSSRPDRGHCRPISCSASCAGTRRHRRWTRRSTRSSTDRLRRARRRGPHRAGSFSAGGGTTA
jgi:pimeloyl-ACP methyl ester carboxylesterase